MGLLSKVKKKVKKAVKTVSKAVDKVVDNPLTNAVASITDKVVSTAYNVSSDIAGGLYKVTEKTFDAVGTATGIKNVVQAVNGTWVGDVVDKVQDGLGTFKSATDSVMNNGLVKGTIIDGSKGFVSGFITGGGVAGGIAGAVTSVVGTTINKYIGYGVDKYVENLTAQKLEEINRDLAVQGLKIDSQFNIYDLATGDKLGKIGSDGQIIFDTAVNEIGGLQKHIINVDSVMISKQIGRY